MKLITGSTFAWLFQCYNDTTCMFIMTRSVCQWKNYLTQYKSPDQLF